MILARSIRKPRRSTAASTCTTRAHCSRTTEIAPRPFEQPTMHRCQGARTSGAALVVLRQAFSSALGQAEGRWCPWRPWRRWAVVLWEAAEQAVGRACRRWNSRLLVVGWAEVPQGPAEQTSRRGGLREEVRLVSTDSGRRCAAPWVVGQLRTPVPHHSRRGVVRSMSMVPPRRQGRRALLAAPRARVAHLTEGLRRVL